MRIAVEDAGPGVPAGERERIFERFARGGAAGRRQSGEGTGLGLSLVAEHVRLHERPGVGGGPQAAAAPASSSSCRWTANEAAPWRARALLGLVAGCGIPLDASPRSVNRDDIPIELLSPAPDVTTSTTAPAALTELIEIYLVRGDRLFAVPRTVPTPLSGPKVLDTLLAGPTSDESATGLRTAISRRASLIVVAVTGVFARVELDQAVVGLQGRDQLLAIGQIVFTLASLSDIDGVEFSFRGNLIEVPTGRGTLKSGPVTTEDYGALEPRRNVTGSTCPGGAFVAGARRSLSANGTDPPAPRGDCRRHRGRAHLPPARRTRRPHRSAVAGGGRRGSRPHRGS